MSKVWPFSGEEIDDRARRSTTGRGDRRPGEGARGGRLDTLSRVTQNSEAQNRTAHDASNGDASNTGASGRQALVGRRYELAEPYLVGREHVRDFARAVQASNRIHFDVEAARAAGYADLVAPATYGAVLQDRAMQLMLADDDADFELQQIVHGDERFTFERPIVAGDELRATLEVTGLRALGANAMLTASTSFQDAAGNVIVTGTATLVIGGGEGN